MACDTSLEKTHKPFEENIFFGTFSKHFFSKSMYIAISATCNKKMEAVEKIEKTQDFTLFKRPKTWPQKSVGKKRKDPDFFDVQKMVV